MLSKKEVEKIAFLAKIRLTEEELEKTPQELEDILLYAQNLNSVNTDEVEPLFHFSELKNVVREDVVESTDRGVQRKMMGMGKDKDGYLKVEPIL